MVETSFGIRDLYCNDEPRLLWTLAALPLAYTFVRGETNPDFGFGGDSSGENRLKLSPAYFADPYDWRYALEQP
jgi:hypothetical protein